MEESWSNRIGETAGKIWVTLDKDGEKTFASLKKTVREPDGVVHEAIGWLAREGKIDFRQQGRTRVYTVNGR